MPAEAETLEELIAPLRADPERSAILTDVDGTLAPIVDDPASARATPAAREALQTLAPRVALAACITGRPALQARELLGLPELTLVPWYIPNLEIFNVINPVAHGNGYGLAYGAGMILAFVAWIALLQLGAAAIFARRDL